MLISKEERERANRAVDLVDLIGRSLTLKPKGVHRVAQCPWHVDDTPSFTVTPAKGIWKCFSCGKHGDAVSWLIEHHGMTMREAVTKLTGEEHILGKQVDKPEPLPVQTWVRIAPVPAGAPEPTFDHHFWGQPVRTWTYTTPEGELIGYICRFETEDGKQLLPYSFASNGHKKRWRWLGFGVPRPLYNWAELEARPEAAVLVVEGEKTADRAKELFPKMVAVAWPGGTNAIEYINWQPLAGRRIIFWPDWDHPGYKAMFAIANKLFALNPNTTFQWFEPPAGVPKGWDLADAEWTPEEARTYALANLHSLPEAVEPNQIPKSWKPIEQPSQQAPEAEPPVSLPSAPPIPPEPEPEQPTQTAVSNTLANFFQFLGWDKTEANKSNYYFYVNAKKAIISIPASGMNTLALLELAPLNVWEMVFPAKKEGQFNLNQAQDYMFRMSDAKGPFSPSIRGRGAWIDQGRVVVHNGPFLLVNSERVELGSPDFRTRHTYENAPDLGFVLTEPLIVDEGRQLLELLGMLNWERPINAALMLGWCSVAPVCGALPWRPHIWLTAPAGGGKSWVFQHVVRRMLAGSALAVQGDSTEAGLRQTLGHDAMPVVFDEAENEDERAASRIQNVLALMRTASADDGGLLVKGSAGGNARSFKIRSCFAYASIVVQLKQQADKSRVSVLGLIKDTSEPAQERFADFAKRYRVLVDDDFVLRMRTRVVQTLPLLLKNTEVFRTVATRILGDARAGDQVGTLLAGAYTLTNDVPATEELAEGWIAENDWSEERSKDETDELKLLSIILERKERVETGNGVLTRNIGELIRLGFGINTGDQIVSELARETLERNGIKVDILNKVFVISNTHSVIREWLRNSAYTQNHSKVLQRLPGAEPTKPMRFGSSTLARGVSIPIDILS